MSLSNTNLLSESAKAIKSSLLKSIIVQALILIVASALYYTFPTQAYYYLTLGNWIPMSEFWFWASVYLGIGYNFVMLGVSIRQYLKL